MDRLLLDIVTCGSIPIYRTEIPDLRYYVWEEDGSWGTRRSTNGKVLISVGLDRRLEAIQVALTSSLVPLNDPGTLVFALRSVEAWQTGVVSNTPTLFVLGGLAFIPGATLGSPIEVPPFVPIEESLPWQIIKQAIHATYKLCKGGQQDPGQHPMVVEALRVYREDKSETEFSKEVREVEARAIAILKANLDAVQEREFDTYGYFHVCGQDKHVYRISRKHSHGIYRIENGVPTFEYCVVADMNIPTCDLMLMLKLLIEADTTQFLEKANAWDIRSGKRKFLKGGPLSIVDSRGCPLPCKSGLV
jgi:hypothetical protein